ncbi:Uncharacterised protein [Salmonella enterica subsp. enterica serovar Typhi]|nr:Uncharacterised protein [Salmonella enterica subsp. enterica serovar Typhi]
MLSTTRFCPRRQNIQSSHNRHYRPKILNTQLIGSVFAENHKQQLTSSQI